jgi:hypothetical protein
MQLIGTKFTRAMRWMTYFRRIALLLCGMAFGLTCFSQAPRWFKGKWTGIGDQPNEGTWAIQLDASDLLAIKVIYPDLDCGGTWTIPIDGIRKRKCFQMQENLQYGHQTCATGVRMIIQKRPHRTLKIDFYQLDYSQYPQASAILRRD